MLASGARGVYPHAPQTCSAKGGFLGRIVSPLAAGEGMRKVVSSPDVKFAGETIVSNNSPGSGLATRRTQTRERAGKSPPQASQVAGKSDLLPADRFGSGFFSLILNKTPAPLALSAGKGVWCPRSARGGSMEPG